MNRTFACTVLGTVLCLVVAGCTTPCNRDGCDAIDKPAADDGKSGIAGAAASAIQGEGDACQDCPFASATLAVWKAEKPITDTVGAQPIIDRGPAQATIEFEGHYRQTLDPGNYLVCCTTTMILSCVGIEVVAGHVTPVNVGIIRPFADFIVFDPETRAPLSVSVFHPSK